MTQEDALEFQQHSAKIQFEQNCRIKAIEVANSYTRTADNPLMPKGRSVEALLSDADKIYKWLIKE